MAWTLTQRSRRCIATPVSAASVAKALAKNGCGIRALSSAECSSAVCSTLAPIPRRGVSMNPAAGVERRRPRQGVTRRQLGGLGETVERDTHRERVLRGNRDTGVDVDPDPLGGLLCRRARRQREPAHRRPDRHPVPHALAAPSHGSRNATRCRKRYHRSGR